MAGPADSPPRAALEAAQAEASATGRALYLYPAADGWHHTRRLAEVSSLPGVLEIRPDATADPERGNTGGC